MCRLFIANAKGSFIEKLYNSLMNAAGNDIFAKGLTHDTGWGYYIANSNISNFYKSGSPIFKDKISLNIDEDKNYHAIFHARLAAKGQPIRGFIDSHPYLIHNKDSLLILAHNGVVDKEIISKELNVDYRLYTDSEILGLLLSKFDGDIDKILYDADKYIKEIGAFIGTFNVIAMKIKRDQDNIKISSACISDYPDNKEDNYKKMVIYKNGDNIAAMSSTVAYYYGILDENGNIIDKNSMICEKGISYKI
ncbi:hypothetical protein Calag_0043 [Caldisphaera lagunensis DSM 15908]|uniref:Glutamine amidotransferase type-2 domain-containing protein n=1 Tax=Caldisphaera lagunensis (strain DSM 15908 / JCM 11604 / ANMR 0165 / IC-154) TaxID=1056495 RepID=L0A9V2_CALLD|nr:hypothetical protein [Caldisphaera lagunensis]AFZ69835.1 hypothetical protein Calag_0043 [Caldisphaera lagunensis DSM 15908]